MFQIFIVLFSLLLVTESATALPYQPFVSKLAARQVGRPPSQDCNATCTAFEALRMACITPRCGCNATYLQAEGDCLLCDTPASAVAWVQLILDAEISECHDDGIPVVSITLQLPPAAQNVVDKSDRDTASLQKYQPIFLALQIIGGHVGLVILLLFSIFSRRVHRDPTFFNFCITWIFTSVVYSISLYHDTGEHTILKPLGGISPNVCLSQAALINGAQIMTACSTMALVIQLWISLKTAIYGDPFNSLKHKQAMTLLLLAAPYAFFFAFSISSIFLGMPYVFVNYATLQRVFPMNFYCCNLEFSSFLRAIYGITLGLLVITLVFDFFIIAILYRHWCAFRDVQTKSGVSFSMLLRVLLFSIYRVFVAIAYGAVLYKPPKEGGTLFGVVKSDAMSPNLFVGVPIWADMLQAAIPLVACLVLGTNADMFRTLIFWRDQQKSP